MSNAAGTTNAGATFAYGFEYHETVLQDVITYNWERGIHLVSGQRYHIRHAYSLSDNAIIIENILWGDTGDGFISESTFYSNDNVSGIAVDYRSGGLLKFIGNKVLQGSQCFRLFWSQESSVGPIIANNSIEGNCTHGIAVQNATSLIGGIIANNEIAVAGTGIYIDPSATWSDWRINDNYIRNTSTNNAISVANSTNFNVLDNNVEGTGGIGVVVGGTASSGIVRTGRTAAGVTAYTGSSATTVVSIPQGMTGSLPTAGPGSTVYLTDGTPGTFPCSTGGTGAYAYKDSVNWRCP